MASSTSLSTQDCGCKVEMLPSPLSNPDSLKLTNGSLEDENFDALVRSVVQDFSIVAEVLRYVNDARKVLDDRLESNIVQLEMAEIRAETALRKSSMARQKIAMIKGWHDIPGDDDTMKGIPSVRQNRDGKCADGERTLTKKPIKDGPEESEMRLNNDLFTKPAISSRADGPRCPFASLGPSALPEGHPPIDNASTQSVDAQDVPSEDDPIAAELGNGSTTGSIASGPAAAKCPIRYLDQHSPEEVARYFEDHKHQIPRSHQLCVKRYQNNEQSIRKLDAKYGNLVSMIQGLGSKHQAFLPPQKVQPNQDHLPPSERQHMANWAENVAENRNALDGEPLTRREETKDWEEEATAAKEAKTATSDEEEAENTDEEGEERKNQFERDWKEVRLGESPSRPWGIAVPESADSVTPSPDPKSSAESSGVNGKQQSQSPPADGKNETVPETRQRTEVVPASEQSSIKSSTLGSALAQACNAYFYDWKQKDDEYQAARRDWLRNFESWRKLEDQLLGEERTLASMDETWLSGPPPTPPEPPKSATNGATASSSTKVEENSSKESKPSHGQKQETPVQIVITGPVFLGYGAKETERFVNAAK